MRLLAAFLNSIGLAVYMGAVLGVLRMRPRWGANGLLVACLVFFAAEPAIRALEVVAQASDGYDVWVAAFDMAGALLFLTWFIVLSRELNDLTAVRSLPTTLQVVERVIGLTLFCVGMVSLLGHRFNTPLLYTWNGSEHGSVGMGISTAVALMITGVGFLVGSLKNSPR